MYSTVEVYSENQSAWCFETANCFLTLTLNCDMDGHHHKYFSVDIAFYNYFVTM